MEEINRERARAIITLVVTCAVNIANVYGFAVDAEQWVNVALSILSAVSIIYAWWKNQNITEEALEGQHVLDRLKAERRAQEG